MSLEGWDTKKLLELLSLIIDFRGRTPKKLNMEWGGGEIPAFSANNVEMGKINFSKECYFGSDALYQKWMTKGDTRMGDILLTMEAPLGNVAQIPDKRRYILSQRTILLRANQQILCNDYFRHYLASEKFQNLMCQQSSGTTATGIQRSKLENLPINFPISRQEQTQIATILSTIDRAIEQTEKLIAKQQRIKTGLMQDLLTKGIDENGNIRSEETHQFKDSILGRIPVEWEVKKLSQLTHQIIDGTHFTPNYVENGVPFLRVTDINCQKIDLEGIKFISEKEHQLLCKRCKPEFGDILYSKNGTIGIPKIVEWDWDFSIFVSLALIKTKQELILSEFLEIVLVSEYIKQQIMIRAKQGTVTNLHLEEIREFDIPIPSIKEQQTISKMSRMINSIKQNEQIKYDKLKSQKTGLMQDLLTGKVRVTELLKKEITNT